MRDQLDQNLIRMPGQTTALNVRMAERNGVAVATTGITIAVGFEKIKHLLCDRPLRRPNRTRPLSDK